MLPPSLGDLSGFLTSRRQNVLLKQEIKDRSHELTTGIARNLSQHLKGDFGHLATIDYELRHLASLKVTIAEADVRMAAKQSTLATISENLQNVSSDVFLALSAVPSKSLETVSANANSALEATLQALNITVAGKSLFSGTAIDSPAVTTSTTLLNAIKTEIAGETTLTAVESRIDDWFDDPVSGFGSVVYLGNSDAPVSLQLGTNRTIRDALRADAPEIREALKAIAKVAIAKDPDTAFSDELTKALLDSASGQVLGASESLTILQTKLGGVEETIDRAKTDNSTRSTSLEIARNELIAVDAYDSATRLESAQIRLESLYSVTARLSRLSLMEYLR